MNGKTGDDTNLFNSIKDTQVNAFLKNLMRLKGNKNKFYNKEDVHGFLYTLFWCPIQHLMNNRSFGGNFLHFDVNQNNFPPIENENNNISASATSLNSLEIASSSEPSGPPNTSTYLPDNMIQFTRIQNGKKTICRCILELKLDNKFPLDPRPEVYKNASEMQEIEKYGEPVFENPNFKENNEDLGKGARGENSSTQKYYNTLNSSLKDEKNILHEKAKTAYEIRKINNEKVPLTYAVEDELGNMFTNFIFNRHIVKWIKSIWYKELFFGKNNCSIRQLFTYMINFGCKYGIVTTVNQWYFVMYDIPNKKLKIAGVFVGYKENSNILQSSSEIQSEDGLWGILIRFLLLSYDYNLNIDSVDDSIAFFDEKKNNKDSNNNGNNSNKNGGNGPSSSGGKEEGNKSLDKDGKVSNEKNGDNDESMENISNEIYDDETDSNRPNWIGRIYLTDLWDPRWWIPGEMVIEKKNGKLPGDAWIVGNGRTGTVYWQHLRNKDMIIKVHVHARPIERDENDNRMAIREEIKNEERIYRILHSLQGDCIPRMYCAGVMRVDSHDCDNETYDEAEKADQNDKSDRSEEKRMELESASDNTEKDNKITENNKKRCLMEIDNFAYINKVIHE